MVGTGIELGASPAQTAFHIQALAFFRADKTSYRYPQVHIRGNLIRNANDELDETHSAKALSIWATDKVLADKNIIDIDSPTPICSYYTDTIATFRNQAPDGTSWDVAKGEGTITIENADKKIPQDIEEAELLSFI